MRLGVRRKTETERRDADVDFSHWLPEGDSITDVSASVSPSGLSIDTVQIHSKMVKVWLSGGEAGKSYKIDVVVSTQEGRVKEACFQVNVARC